jgi:hypothetical protein
MEAELPPSGPDRDPRDEDHTLDWWKGQALIDRDRAERAERREADAHNNARWAVECAVVALRMLQRVGTLKATTEDERKVIKWSQQLYQMNLRGANRRLGSPDPELYDESAEANAQAVLFGAGHPAAARRRSDHLCRSAVFIERIDDAGLCCIVGGVGDRQLRATVPLAALPRSMRVAAKPGLVFFAHVNPEAQATHEMVVEQIEEGWGTGDGPLHFGGEEAGGD